MKLEREDRTIYLCLAALAGISGWVLSFATNISLIATLPICAAFFIVGGHFAFRAYVDRAVAAARALTTPAATTEIPGIGTLLDFHDYWELQLDDLHLIDDADATMYIDKCGTEPHPSQLELAISFWALYDTHRGYLVAILSEHLSRSGAAASLENYFPNCDSVYICCPDADHELTLTFNLREPMDGFTSISLRDWVAIEVESGD